MKFCLRCHVRVFLRWLGSRRGCEPTLWDCIHAPRLYRHERYPQGPTWPQVQQLLDSANTQMLQPYRPLMSAATAVCDRQKSLGQQLKRYGSHGLRHACATHLLSEGFNLKQIGDHLGHSVLQATEISAKVDVASLMTVGDVDLSELIEFNAACERRHSRHPDRFCAMRAGATVWLCEGAMLKTLACINSYVKYRQSLGIGFVGEKGRLKAFAQSVGDIHLRAVTPRAVRRYLDGNRPITNGWLYKYHVLNGFYRFAISRKYVSASPLPQDKPHRQRSFVPYIYSIAEIKSLLEATGQRYRNRWLLSPATMKTILLLLYGSGLRISEALALNEEDVDLRASILTIRQTKFYKSRLVPIGADLRNLLIAYHRRHRAGTAGKDKPFLTDRTGRRIAKQTAQRS